MSKAIASQKIESETMNQKNGNTDNKMTVSKQKKTKPVKKTTTKPTERVFINMLPPPSDKRLKENSKKTNDATNTRIIKKPVIPTKKICKKVDQTENMQPPVSYMIELQYTVDLTQ